MRDHLAMNTFTHLHTAGPAPGPQASCSPCLAPATAEGPSPRRQPARQRLGASAALLLGAALLAGCAGLKPEQGLAKGQSEAAVAQAMGQPTNRYPMADGATRLEFARGPAGYSTWMVDLDAQGKVTGFESVLDAAHFNRVKRGMSADEVLRLLGRPADKQREFTNRESWYWRYTPYECVWYAVTLSPRGQVIEAASQLPDPRCDPSQ